MICTLSAPLGACHAGTGLQGGCEGIKTLWGLRAATEDFKFKLKGGLNLMLCNGDVVDFCYNAMIVILVRRRWSNKAADAGQKMILRHRNGVSFLA